MASSRKTNVKDHSPVTFYVGHGDDRDCRQGRCIKSHHIQWCAADGWKEARAAKTITRPELVNMLLSTIHKLLVQVGDADDPASAAGLADKLSKLAAVIEKLDKKANVVDAIEVFKSLTEWLERRAATDPDVTPELIKMINKIQDKYIIESIGSNNLN